MIIYLKGRYEDKNIALLILWLCMDIRDTHKMIRSRGLFYGYWDGVIGLGLAGMVS